MWAVAVSHVLLGICDPLFLGNQSIFQTEQTLKGVESDGNANNIHLHDNISAVMGQTQIMYRTVDVLSHHKVSSW